MEQGEQLNLFGDTTAPVEPVADPYAIQSSDIWDLEFGPVRSAEASTDTAFLSQAEYSQQDNLLAREEYFSAMRKQRIAALLEEVALDDNVLISGFDGRKGKALKPVFIPMVMDRLAGLSMAELARKYDRSHANLYALFNRPSVRKFMAKVLAEFSVNLGDVKARIDAHATEAIETVVDIMRTGKEENRQKSAFAILRMAGHDNASGTASVTINNQPLDSSVVERTDKLLEALLEANQAQAAGYSQYVDTMRVSDKREIQVVEAPVGLKKIASAG